MEILQAEFIKSSAHIKECPPHDLPEYAFIGRSNVGKSSLINMLTIRKYLAKISGTPGKTQLINHFKINALGKPWYLVDLPGFGYAKVSRTSRQSWAKTSEHYLVSRKNLMCVMLLIDSRHPPQKVDLEFMEWMGEKNLSFVMVFTKLDKLNKEEKAAFLPRYEERMLQQWHKMPPVFCTSAVKGDGRRELMDFIGQSNDYFDPSSLSDD